LANTADRVLYVLGLFTHERPEWTVDAAARELRLSQSTAYQYFRSLIDARLLVASRSGRYRIGPAIIEFDRQIRQLDPLIRGADPVMNSLSESLEWDGVALLCRIYGLTGMCVDQRARAPRPFAVSYERGRPMPLFRGAASKAILAELPLRPLRRHYEQSSQAIAESGLGADWKSFRSNLRKIRRQGVCVTYEELDAGMMGISAPVFGPGNEILGSIGLVVTIADVRGVDDGVSRLSLRVKQAGQDVTRNLQSDDCA
jgi:DNA-binding IclR family transcriptional regulator